MNGTDFYKIQAFAKSGGYNVTHLGTASLAASIFELPDVSYRDLARVLWKGIDWDRFMDDFVNGLLGKLGSFADDWYFLQLQLGSRVVPSQPGIREEDVGDNELVRVQGIVLRKLKLCAARRCLFHVESWKRFCQLAEEPWTYVDYETIEGKVAEAGEREETQMDRRHSYAKLSYIRYLNLNWETGCPHVDDLIALHREGKYTLPGKRINFANLRYKDDT